VLEATLIAQHLADELGLAELINAQIIDAVPILACHQELKVVAYAIQLRVLEAHPEDRDAFDLVDEL
jgi:hypothetical protein